ncbi:MAG: hypothetical protein KTR31_37690 [Myxococcales bacterium]|nr:hypothetical protein [Myxococcales bacterium]
MRTTSLLAVLALSAMSCVIENELPSGLPDPEKASPVPPAEVSNTDEIVQVSVPLVDVLFVVDNSGSMRAEQEALTENFPSFINYFIGSGLNYHLGVVSTDMQDPSHSGKLRIAGGYKWIDDQTQNPEGVFTAMASLGINGSGTERPIGATYAAIEELKDGYNQGYYRDEASIHTIVVTDEGDSTQPSYISLPEFITWYDGLKPEEEMRTFSGIVQPQSGAVYRDVNDDIGGILFDIGQDNWSEVLDRLGVQASGLKREYFLSQQPVLGTIEVSVEETLPDGGTLQISFDEYVDGEGDWTYDPSRNSITFVQFVPNALSRVQLTYDLRAATQDEDPTVVETAE